MATLGEDEGLRDGLWLGLLYLVGGHLYPVIEGLATLVAVRNWGGVMVVFSALGVLLAPIFASILAETVLGSERGQRGGLCLAPLVVVSLGAQVLARSGVGVPWPSWAPAAMGVLGSVGLAAWIRADKKGPTRCERPRVFAIVGLLVVTTAIVLGILDVRRGASDWSRLGPLPPGERVENFRVAMLDGGVLDSSGLEGKVSVVTFWATWCGVCVGELSDLDALAEQYQGRDVQFVAVNREGGGVTPAQAVHVARSFARQRGLSLPIAIDDGSMAQTFRVGPIPHTVVFDTTATVRHVHQGRVTSATLASEIDELLRRR
jgi:thiol-disulfide isomerase/thioredoxin